MPTYAICSAGHGTDATAACNIVAIGCRLKKMPVDGLTVLIRLLALLAVPFNVGLRPSLADTCAAIAWGFVYDLAPEVEVLSVADPVDCRLDAGLGCVAMG